MRTLSGAIILLAGAVLFGAGSITEGLLEIGHGYTSAGRFAMLGGVLFGVFGFILVIGGILDRDRREPPPHGPARPR
jgi:hypothetical protein